MRKVIKHGQFYQEKKKIAGIPYVECPECGSRIDIDLDYLDYSEDYYSAWLVQCKCECRFSFEEEDIMYKKLR